MSEEFDLLGDPIPAGFGRRGRPPHLVTDEKRKLVIMLQAFDWSTERIAAALSITAPTLRKNYFRELRVRAEARARTEAMLIGALAREAAAGNVSAIDKYFKRLDRHDLAQLADDVANRGSKAPRPGKKEQAQQAAVDVGGKYAPPKAPGRLVN